MRQRPNRPTQEFLHKIGIFHIQDDTDITFDDRVGHYDHVRKMWVSPRAFNVTRVDGEGTPLVRTIIPAFEHAARTKHDIWNHLRDTLVTSFNAIPVQRGLMVDLSAPRPKRPPETFLHAVGVKDIPHNVDVTIRDNGVDCAKAFIIQKIGNNGEVVSRAEISARDTRAYNAQVIWQRVGETLVREFGAMPLQP